MSGSGTVFSRPSGRAVMLTAVLWALSPLQADAASRPNILFIVTDDQSHRSLSCYPEAYPWVRTPHIDRLADEGVRFAPAYIGTWCLPSRATMLTGLHPTGVQSLRRLRGERYPANTYDPEQAPFWPKVFRQHGYQTAHIGKWHTGSDTGFGRDWDYQVVWNRPGHPENALHYYHDQLISINGGEPRLQEGYSTDNYTRWAVEYVRGGNRDADKPWYLWLCYDAPHGPFTPADRHREEYKGETIPVPADVYPPRPGKPAYMQAVETWLPGPRGEPVIRDITADGVLRYHADRLTFPETLNDWARLYHQSVCGLDDGIGELLRALEETGQREDTLIVFTSDQGLAVGQHGFLDKHAPYDANIAAPLMFSMPGTLPQGAACDAVVSGPDLIPTFFRFAGIELPWGMHGRDLTPLLKRPDEDWPHPALVIYTRSTFGDDTLEINEPPARRDRVPWYLVLRDGRYKYIRTLEADEIEELYDLEEDPQELTSLAAEPRHAGRLAAMRAATLAELRRIGAGFVDHLPPIAEPGT